MIVESTRYSHSSHNSRLDIFNYDVTQNDLPIGIFDNAGNNVILENTIDNIWTNIIAQ